MAVLPMLEMEKHRHGYVKPWAKDHVPVNTIALELKPSQESLRVFSEFLLLLLRWNLALYPRGA